MTSENDNLYHKIGREAIERVQEKGTDKADASDKMMALMYLGFSQQSSLIESLRPFSVRVLTMVAVAVGSGIAAIVGKLWS